jgi:hypothetical protein
MMIAIQLQKYFIKKLTDIPSLEQFKALIATP